MSGAIPSSPDVLVLGMPSSGKTVFLSVLGRDFTLVADDSDARPLGFRMRAIGRSTLETVSRNYAKLLGGEWPASTVAGSITPLTWDVFTGARKVFTLSSMDISGESFVAAFSEEGREAARKKDDDGLLDVADNETTMADVAAGILREQAASAKVICFFINIAAARRGQLRGVARGGQRDFDAIKNYEDGIANICALLDEYPELRSKALVVLTQAHRHQAEIEKAGGPAAYLGRIAPNLRQSVSEFSIPVIAVSAINEPDSGMDFDDDDEDGNTVPDTIESDGLFGFLLVVAGMIPDARLSHVKECYLRYLADKSRSLQLSCRTILERMPLIESYASSGREFVQACSDYLKDPSNVNSPEAELLPMAAIDLYRRCTMSDKDVVVAGTAWKRRLAIDRSWDRVFRRIALAEARAAADESGVREPPRPPSAQEIVEEVRAEIAKESGDAGGLTFAALYGFERDELNGSRDAADEYEWVLKCLDEYRRRIVDDLDGYMQLFVQARQTISEADPERDGDFKYAMDAVADGVSRCRERSARFRREWIGGAGGLAQLDALDAEVQKLAAEVDDLEARHAKWLDKMEVERQKRAVAEAQARQAAYEREAEERRRMRRSRRLMAAFVLLLVAAMLGVLFLRERAARVGQNVAHWEMANRDFEKRNFDGAKRHFDAIVDDPGFLISREGTDRDYEQFEGRLNDAIKEEQQLRIVLSEISNVQDKVESLRKEAVQKEAEQLARNALDAADKSRREADKAYADAVIDAKAYLARLNEVKGLYEKVRDAAKERQSARDQQIAAAQKRYDDARKEAEKASEGRFALIAIADAKGERETLDRTRSVIGSDLYVKRLGEIEAKLKAAVSAAGEEKKAYAAAAAKRAADQQKITSASGGCSAARVKAVEKGAEQFATKELGDVDALKDACDERFLKGQVTLEQYVSALKDVEKRYSDVTRVAIKNARPIVRLSAKRFDNDSQVAARITNGLLTPCDTLANGWLDVSIDESEVGKKKEFSAEYVENGVRYVGSVSVVAKKGPQNVTMLLFPQFTLPSEIKFCGGCGYSLKNDRHVRYCPNCKRDVTAFKSAR